MENFALKKGPLFSNFVLADEINRAPAKVQSALLETMQEKQITIGGQTFLLPEPFLVLATQNPIEQEGTYPLPEAQVDRFLLKILVQYPTPEEELEMLHKMGQILPTANNPISPILLGSEIIEARKVVDRIYVNEALMKYMVDLVTATRHPEQFKNPKFAIHDYLWSFSKSLFVAIALCKGTSIFKSTRLCCPSRCKRHQLFSASTPYSSQLRSRSRRNEHRSNH